jgi:hypothetical protein
MTRMLYSPRLFYKIKFAQRKGVYYITHIYNFGVNTRQRSVTKLIVDQIRATFTTLVISMTTPPKITYIQI